MAHQQSYLREKGGEKMLDKPKNDECYTPQWVFDALNTTFDLDVASGHSEYIVTPAARKYTVDDDGLALPWEGKVWMNPPFSKITPWINKFLEHGNGVCLVPLSSNGRWVNQLWDSKASVAYLPANMAFVTRTGELIKHRWRCSMWAIGEESVENLRGIGRVR
jgi:hypothetical protein